MSTRYNNGSHYENHQRAAELHDGAAHAHRVAEQHGKAGSPDRTRAYQASSGALARRSWAYSGGSGGHGIAAFGHEDIAALAHELWQARGCPEGSPEEDWFHAAEQLRARSYTP